jgi:flagellar assembly protein FliH
VAKNSSANQKKGDTVTLYEPARFDHLRAEISSVDDAKNKAEMLKKSQSEGFDKGFSEGLEQGIRAGQKEIVGRLRRLDSIIYELDHVKEKKIQEILPEIVDLSLEIAKKLVHKKIEQDRDIIIAVVREAVRKLGREDKMVIRVNPVDYDTMLSNLEVLREEARLKDIIIEPAEAISPGGCYIESPTAEVDARIEEQIRELRDAITTALDS